MEAKNTIFKNIISKFFLVTVTCAALSACSTYPSKFKCGDAKGLGCTMVREIDTKIDSGEIEVAYMESNKNKKCKNCVEGVMSNNTGLLEESGKSRARLHKTVEKSKLIEDGYINF